MEQIVTENLDEIHFLKLVLKTEIKRIKMLIDNLSKYEAVKHYIELCNEILNSKRNKVLTLTEQKLLESEKEALLITYIEVKKYIESLETLDFYRKSILKLNNLICINNNLYTKERKTKKTYSQELIKGHLVTIKNELSLPLDITLEELNYYIRTVKNVLQSYEFLESDEIIDDILGYKIYENPRNYQINEITKIPNNIIFQEKENLNKREEKAFYNEEIYSYYQQKTKVKRR